MYVTRRLKQTAEFAKKLDKSREFFMRDLTKENDTRILAHPSVMADYVKEYNILTANEYDYCHPKKLQKLLVAKQSELVEKTLLLEKFPEHQERLLAAKNGAAESEDKVHASEISTKNQEDDSDKIESLDEQIQRLKSEAMAKAETKPEVTKLEESTEAKPETEPEPAETSLSEYDALALEVQELENKIAKLEIATSRLPENFDPNHQMSLEEYKESFIQEYEKMDQVFREHKAGWHHIIPTKASTKDQLPYLETDNYKHEVLYVPGFDWLLDTTTRKLPKTYGLEAHAHRFPATFHAKVYTGLKYALITKLLRRKSRPTRLSDQVLYYSKYTPSISPEYVMRKIKTVENKFDHEADYKTYMENVNQQFIQKSYLISMMFAIFFAFWVAIFYTEYDDERAEARDTWTRAQMNKIFGLIYSNQDWENDAVKLKKNAYNTRAMYLKDQDDGKNPSQPVDPNQSFWQGQQEIAQNSSLNPSNYIKSPYDKKR